MPQVPKLILTKLILIERLTLNRALVKRNPYLNICPNLSIDTTKLPNRRGATNHKCDAWCLRSKRPNIIIARDGSLKKVSQKTCHENSTRAFQKIIAGVLVEPQIVYDQLRKSARGLKSVDDTMLFQTMFIQPLKSSSSIRNISDVIYIIAMNVTNET